MIYFIFCTLSNKSAEKKLQYRTFIHFQGYHCFIVSHKAIFFFDIITLPIYVSESFGYILASTIQKKGKSTYYTKYFSIFVINIITLYHHIGLTIIKQSIELSYKYDNEQNISFSNYG